MNQNLVCGAMSKCVARLNRPVCTCPDGYEGNPYEECTKVNFTEVMVISTYNLQYLLEGKCIGMKLLREKSVDRI